MKPLVIYHDNCADGFGAAFAAWLKLGDEAEYLPCQYGRDTLDPSKVQYEDREVYILDFSFPREIMERLFAATKRVVWLDHHKTAFEMWCGPQELFIEDTQEPEEGTIVGRRIVLDNNKSGALLAWEYFHPNTEVPMLIQHIDDRDRWQWKLRCSAEIHAALGSMQPWSFEQWEELIQPEHYGSLCTEGAAILRAQKQRVEQIAGHARKCYIQHPHGGDNDWVFASGLAVNAPMHQSEVGHELANQSGTFGLAWYLAEDNTVRCSFRSNENYDVSAIARVFGGGGHRNAAGCGVSIETLLDWLK